MIKKLDHVNIRTNRLQPMIDFYERVLKLSKGPRPAFAFDGAWLYCNSEAVVHLVHTDESLQNRQPQLEHFALKAENFEQTRAHLVQEQVSHRISPVPGYALTQIHLRDVDGNHIELNFDEVVNGLS